MTKQTFTAINPKDSTLFKVTSKRPYQYVVFHYGLSAAERKDGADYSNQCVGECLHLTLEAALKDAASNKRAVIAKLSVAN